MGKGKGLWLIMAAIMLFAACGKAAPVSNSDQSPSAEPAALQTSIPAGETEAELLAFLQEITSIDPALNTGLGVVNLRPYAAAIAREYSTGQRPGYFTAYLREGDGSTLLTLYYRQEPGVFLSDQFCLKGEKVTAYLGEEATLWNAGVLLEEPKRLIFTRQTPASCPFEVENCPHAYRASELLAMDLESRAITQLLPARIYLELAVTQVSGPTAGVQAIWHVADNLVAFLDGTIDVDTLTVTQTGYREEIVDPMEYHQDMLTQGDRVAWAAIGEVPVSILVDGVQQITGFENAHHPVREQLKALTEGLDIRPRVFPTANSFSGRSPDYAPLAADTIEIGGDWAPFPVAVIWRSYTPANQPYETQWTEYFASILADMIPDSPVLITDVFYVDLDGDGTDEAIVNAGNVFLTDHGAAVNPNPPAGDRAGWYSITALFSETLGDHILYGDVELISKAPGTETGYFDRYDEGTEYFSHYSTWQVDQDGNVILSPLFGSADFHPVPTPLPIVFDCDGDGQAELMFVRRTVSFPYPVYKVVDGALILSHSVIFPA